MIEKLNAKHELVTHQLAQKRVLFVNRSYWPDDGATGQLLTQLCEDLSEHTQVSVLCGALQVDPKNSIYENIAEEAHPDVEIIRVRHTNFNKRHFLGRLLNMITFTINAGWTMFRMPKPDLMIVETDPPFLCVLGWLMVRIRKIRLVCYLQDIYPDVAVASGKIPNGLIAHLIRKIFVAGYRCADRVIVLSQNMWDHVANWDIPESRLRLIRNWADTQRIMPEKEGNRFRHVNDLEDRFVVMYSGNMGLTQPLEDLLDAAHMVRDDKSIAVVLSGQGARRDQVVAHAEKLQLDNVYFFDFQPESELSNLMSAADVHVVFLSPDFENLLMPSKIYNVMASGSPVIVAGSSNTELAKLCRSEDIGVVTGHNEPEQLAAAIRLLASDPSAVEEMGIRARKAAENRYSRHHAIDLFKDFLTEMLVPKPSFAGTEETVEIATESHPETLVGKR